MEKDLISVIVPVYNVEKYLDRCLESIINQTYKNIEIILVDDGSNDNSGNICDDYAKKDSRIKIIHKENGGLSDARNAGIAIARGDYITLVDSDDYILNDYVEFLYDNLIENNADVSICKHYVKYDDGGRIDTSSGKLYVLNSKECLEMMLYCDDMDVSAWAKLYKTELFKNVKYPKGQLFEDSATTYKLIDKAKKIAFNSKAKYIYYIRKNSITTAEFNPRKMDLIKSTNEMCNYVIDKYPELAKAAKRRLMYAYLSTLTQLAKNDKKGKNKEYRIEIMNYIREHRKEELDDKEIPKRDRIALYCTRFGFNFFKISWKLYERITGRN